MCEIFNYLLFVIIFCFLFFRNIFIHNNLFNNLLFKFMYFIIYLFNIYNYYFLPLLFSLRNFFICKYHQLQQFQFAIMLLSCLCCFYIIFWKLLKNFLTVLFYYNFNFYFILIFIFGLSFKLINCFCLHIYCIVLYVCIFSKWFMQKFH